ncbi:MAG: transposase [Candidatus Reconcilbacillus cellulovorans]|uniref:Transposase n=1 Tax=Candidatus Reconcilbacillus cellulovorans TaxID=1906605 RepID=A0A2A6E0E8_9BACL|nr:MAG: transposase [Candidatus Reconcilbacillus cellulovorans]
MPQRISHDRLFKQLISTFFEDFMTLFFPEAARHIDFSHLAFLRQELFTDVARGDVRYVDLLVETKLKGEDGVIVVHVETQAARQRDFHERMFLYFARLYEKLRKRIVPVAVFGYRRGEDEPDGFEMVFPFLEVLTFRFYALELGKLNWRAYAEKDNPVAAALLAKMGYGQEERVQVRLSFLRMLARLKLDPARARLVAGFFEAYMPMEEGEEAMLREELKSLGQEERESVFEVMTYWEKKGFQKGLEQGLEQGQLKERRELAKRMLAKGMPEPEVRELTGLSEEELAGLRSNGATGEG